ncbi:MAG: polysaccharide biosynthesis C-terminal domain-containing protein [Candidatus Omnitrophica bacterium]|nr:polysaccharide biosynthesis C-terminal domain-containing protein [Candidatus Omnitrophota bacterium]
MLEDNIKKISMKSAIANYLGKLITTIVDASTFILITKKLILNDYGIYSFLMAILTFFAFFASLGIPQTLLRFIPEYIERDKKGTAVYIIKLSLYAITTLGILLIISSFFVANKIAFIFKIDALVRLLPVLVFIGILSIIIKAEEEILNALFMQVFRNSCQALLSLLKLSLFIAVLQYRLGIDWLVMAIAIVGILHSLLYFKKIYTYFLTKEAQGEPSKAELRRFSIFSVKEYLYIASAFFWEMSFDIYVIAYLLGSVGAGLFNFASSIAFFVLYWSPGVVLQSIISPLFIKQHLKYNDPDVLNNLFQLYNKFKAFFVFPIILSIWALIDKFVLIVYQNKFEPSIFTLKILVLAVVLQTFTIPIKVIFNVFEKNEYALYSNVVIIYRICASIILIKQMGIIGAAYAYGSSTLLIFLLYFFFAKRLIKISYPLRSFLKILFNSLMMMLFLVLCKRFIGDNLVLLLVVVILGILVYLLLSYINKPFKKQERSLINEGLRIPLWNF